MKPFREMNDLIFRVNLISTLKEFKFTGTPIFKISSIFDASKTASADGYDDTFRLVILGEKNLKGRLMPLEEVVELLSCFKPLVPTQIKVKLIEDKNGEALFELLTSTRVRKPSQLANIETGHTPFKAI